MRRRGLSMCGALLMSFGCSGAELNVHVRDAREPKPLSSASVLLFDVVDDVCSNDPSGGRLSDQAGNARVNARWCGRAKLVVAAHDYAPSTRELDSCEAHDVVMELSRLAAEPAGADDPSVQVARRFLSALAARDRATIEALLAEPKDGELYTAGGVAERGKPDAMRFVGMRAASPAQAQFDLYYATGCREPWLVELISDGQSFLVTSATMAASP